MVRVLMIATHPVQYATPLFRRYSEDPHLDLTVVYCGLGGAVPAWDPDFRRQIAWDVPLLEGHRWVHPRNVSPREGVHSFLGLVNPGVWGLIRRGHFDVVVCFGWRAATFWIAIAAAKASGAKVVFSSDAHELEPRVGTRAKRALKAHLLPVILRAVDAVIAPSTAARRLSESLVRGKRPIYLVPYVVDNDFFAAGAARMDRDAARSAWGVPQEAAVAAFVGKLSPWKRPQDLVHALARSPGWYALIAGDGELRGALEAEAAALGLADRCRFLGFVNQTELPRVYTASDLLVLPSEYEPFGLVVNEAFACGRPAIVSDACGAVGDLVRPDETGWIYAAGDVEALSAALDAARSDLAMLRSKGDSARAAVQRWGPDANVQAMVAMCETLSESRRAESIGA